MRVTLRNCRLLAEPRIRLIVYHIHRRTFLYNGPDTVEELLERHLVKDSASATEEDERTRLTSTRREALSLYRDVLRATRFFTWRDSKGVLWRDILRDNARREFEDSRLEKDPEVITRLLIGGREAVQKAVDKLVEKHQQELEKQRDGGNRR